MKIKLNKITDGKWHVLSNGEFVGVCITSHRYHGCYEVTLNNGITIYTFSQKSVKEKVAKLL